MTFKPFQIHIITTKTFRNSTEFITLRLRIHGWTTKLRYHTLSRTPAHITQLQASKRSRPQTRLESAAVSAPHSRERERDRGPGWCCSSLLPVGIRQTPSFSLLPVLPTVSSWNHFILSFYHTWEREIIANFSTSISVHVEKRLTRRRSFGQANTSFSLSSEPRAAATAAAIRSPLLLLLLLLL